MNIKLSNTKQIFKSITPLFENQNQIVVTDENKIEEIIKSKSNQFIFDCGSYLGLIPIKLNTKFCLYWYLNNTNNFEEFITEIENFLKNSENELTENDVKKLFIHYEKYFKMKQIPM